MCAIEFTCKKLKEETVICARDYCSDSFLSKNEYHIHVQSAPEFKYVYEFDRSYLRIGAGYYEMHLVESFFVLNSAGYNLLRHLVNKWDLHLSRKLFAKTVKIVIKVGVL